MLKGEPCPWMLLRQARDWRGRWSGSSLTHAKPCHPVLPVMGSGCSCNAGDMGRDIPGWLRPVAPALPPLVALWLWVHPTGCARRHRVLRVQPRTRGLGHTPWPGTVGHGPPSPGADSGLAGWGWGFCQQIDRQTEGMIHVSSCGPRAKKGERFDVRMRAGRCGCCSGSCRELRLLAAFPLPEPTLPTLPGGPGLAWGQKTTEAT